MKEWNDIVILYFGLDWMEMGWMNDHADPLDLWGFKSASFICAG